jgi:hypothetical protein
MVKQSIEHVGCVAHRRVNDFGVEGRARVGGNSEAIFAVGPIRTTVRFANRRLLCRHADANEIP